MSRVEKQSQAGDDGGGEERSDLSQGDVDSFEQGVFAYRLLASQSSIGSLVRRWGKSNVEMAPGQWKDQIVSLRYRR